MSDCGSDVCSSDLVVGTQGPRVGAGARLAENCRDRAGDLTCGLKARASMLAPASRPRRAAVVDLLAPDAALTDPDPAARPAPNENHLLINADRKSVV